MCPARTGLGTIELGLVIDTRSFTIVPYKQRLGRYNSVVKKNTMTMLDVLISAAIARLLKAIRIIIVSPVIFDAYVFPVIQSESKYKLA